jgi:hypothetical protein
VRTMRTQKIPPWREPGQRDKSIRIEREIVARHAERPHRLVGLLQTGAVRPAGRQYKKDELAERLCHDPTMR